MSEKLAAAQLKTQLNEYLSAMTAIIFAWAERLINM
jgi:hypothetical protein